MQARDTLFQYWCRSIVSIQIGVTGMLSYTVIFRFLFCVNMMEGS